jgi:hypothetical protein
MLAPQFHHDFVAGKKVKKKVKGHPIVLLSSRK